MHIGAYPTPAQTSIFINDIWIDDAYRIEFRVQDPKYPLYGYNEPEFTAVARGRKLVLGNLTINYRFPGYLTSAIEDTYVRTPNVRDEVTLAEQILRADSIAQRIQLLDEARLGGYEDHVVEQIEQYWKNNNDQGRQHLLVSEVNLRHQVNLVLRYGGRGELVSRYNINDVKFTGQAQTLSAAATSGGDSSASGMPIYEIYSFIARDITPVIARKEYSRFEDSRLTETNR